MYKDFYRQSGLIFIFITLGVWLYKPGLSGFFIFDDGWNILQNESLHVTNFNTEHLWSAAMSGHSGTLKRPISMLSFAFNHMLTGLNPYWMKLTNLCIHIINYLLILFLVREILKKLLPEYPVQKRSFISLLIASAWLLHPIQVTAVSYIVQRMTSLSAMFILLSILSYLHIRKNLLGRVTGYSTFILTLLSILFGLLSKETALLTPLYILICEIYLYKFKYDDNKEKLHLFVMHSVLILPLLFAVAWVCIDFEEVVLSTYEHRTFSISERLMSQGRVLVEYIRLIFIPDITNMDIYRDDITVSKSLFDPTGTVICLVLILGLFRGIILTFISYPLISMGISWFFVSHLLESTIFGLELSFLHRNYLASLGIILVISQFLLFLYQYNWKTCRLLLIIIFLIISTSTRLLNWQWSNNLDQLLIAGIRHPDSVRANLNSANLYYYLAFANTNLMDREDAIKQAEYHMENIEQLIPKSAAVDYQIIQNYVNGNQPVSQKLVKSAQKKSENLSIDMLAMQGFQSISSCVNTKICSLSDSDYQSLVSSLLKNANLKNTFKIILLTRYALFNANKLHDYEYAIQLQSQAIELNPKKISLLINYINYKILNGNLNDAESQIELLEKKDIFKRHSIFIREKKREIKSINHNDKKIH